jgi:hypothetical protein
MRTHEEDTVTVELTYQELVQLYLLTCGAVDQVSLDMDLNDREELEWWQSLRDKLGKYSHLKVSF